jgi:D-alanine transaminase
LTDELLYLNGSVMPLAEGTIQVEDRGLQLGDGVYEVVKVMNGQAVWLQGHLDRLDDSLTAIRFQGALVDHSLAEVIPRLIEDSGIVQGFAYIQVTRGVGPREFDLPTYVRPTVLAYVRSGPPLSAEKILAGQSVHPVEDRRWALCNIKAIDLLATILAKEEARQADADEALFVGPNGRVREGGSSNVFAYIRGIIRTHPADEHILDGVTRRFVLDVAREAGYSVREEAFRLSDITSNYDPECEVFLTSTLRDIMPVVRLGDHVIGEGRPGRVTLALLDLFRAHQAAVVGADPPIALS